MHDETESGLVSRLLVRRHEEDTKTSIKSERAAADCGAEDENIERRAGAKRCRNIESGHSRQMAGELGGQDRAGAIGEQEIGCSLGKQRQEEHEVVKMEQAEALMVPAAASEQLKGDRNEGAGQAAPAEEKKAQPQRASVCAGCRGPIRDKFIFSVIDLLWHQDCVQCSDCALKLHERCFTYEGKLYCPHDYWHRFGPKCFACHEPINKSELVQRIKGNRVYHLKCFTCSQCNRRLERGEQLHLIDDRQLLCKQDYQQLGHQQTPAATAPAPPPANMKQQKQQKSTTLAAHRHGISNGFMQHPEAASNNSSSYFTLLSPNQLRAEDRTVNKTKRSSLTSLDNMQDERQRHHHNHSHHHHHHLLLQGHPHHHHHHHHQHQHHQLNECADEELDEEDEEEENDGLLDQDDELRQDDNEPDEHEHEHNGQEGTGDDVELGGSSSSFAYCNELSNNNNNNNSSSNNNNNSGSSININSSNSNLDLENEENRTAAAAAAVAASATGGKHSQQQQQQQQQATGQHQNSKTNNGNKSAPHSSTPAPTTRRRRRRKRAADSAKLDKESGSLAGPNGKQAKGKSILNGGQSASILASMQGAAAAGEPAVPPQLKCFSSSSTSSTSSTVSNHSTSSTTNSQRSSSGQLAPGRASVHHHHHLSQQQQQQQQSQRLASHHLQHNEGHHNSQSTGAGGGGGGGGHKPTRVRTVLNEKQLQTLRDCYAHNPRPDALMKEQLVDMTGLSPRVIRVWFQNKRCKDKKKSILYKQMQQHEKDGRHLAGLTHIRGVPLVASSPIQYQDEHSSAANAPTDSPQQSVQSPSQLVGAIQPPSSQQQQQQQHQQAQEQSPGLEIHAYQPPWKSLVDYAQQPQPQGAAGNGGGKQQAAVPGQQQQQQPAPPQPPPDRLSAMSPRYQQLIGQMHGYGNNNQVEPIPEQHQVLELHSASQQQQPQPQPQPPAPPPQYSPNLMLSHQPAAPAANSHYPGALAGLIQGPAQHPHAHLTQIGPQGGQTTAPPISHHMHQFQH